MHKLLTLMQKRGTFFTLFLLVTGLWLPVLVYVTLRRR